ncbi:MAG TPA: 4-hydroxy-tetrahydrodipicolinate synthase [Cyclobacteriaceae bacterium]
MEFLKGTGVALVTPFNDDLKVDYHSLEKLLIFMQDHVDYWVLSGTTGESATTTWKEKTDILNFVSRNNILKKPIIFGLGGNNTSAVIESIQSLDHSIIDAILSVSPYYNKPGQQGIIKHYQAIADHSESPLILYNVPARTSVNIASGTTLKLAEHQNIIGIKEASGSLNQCAKIATDSPDNFLLISGNDMDTFPMISLGAVGAISVMANILPDVYCTLVRGALKNDRNKEKIAYRDLYHLNELLIEEGNPTGVKAALSLKNLIKNNLRLPLLKSSQQLYEKISNILIEKNW